MALYKPDTTPFELRVISKLITMQSMHFHGIGPRFHRLKQ